MDVGCGAGLLSMALCRLGADVVGLDACEKTIDVAQTTANNILKIEQLRRLNYSAVLIEDFSKNNAESKFCNFCSIFKILYLYLGFDGVIASEVVEHVNDLSNFVKSCVLLTKSGSNAPLLFTTINKTFLSRIMAIWLAEVVF